MKRHIERLPQLQTPNAKVQPKPQGTFTGGIATLKELLLKAGE